MAKKRITKRELKRDEFIEIATKFIFFARRHKEILIGAVVAILIGIFGISYHLKGKRGDELKAEFELTVANNLFLRGDYENAFSQYQLLIDRYGGTRPAKKAIYYLANTAFTVGSYEEAIRKYERFLSVESKDEILLPSTLFGIAASYEQLGDWLGAATYYEKVSEKFPDSFIAPRALLNAGRCYENISLFDEAESAYRKVKEKYANSMVILEAETALAFLKGRREAH